MYCEKIKLCNLQFEYMKKKKKDEPGFIFLNNKEMVNLADAVIAKFADLHGVSPKEVASRFNTTWKNYALLLSSIIEKVNPKVTIGSTSLCGLLYEGRTQEVKSFKRSFVCIVFEYAYGMEWDGDRSLLRKVPESIKETG